MAEIRVEHLRKAFGDFVAVQDSTFTVASGEFLVMLGPSGCGKTTTLRMIAGLELPTSGHIRLDGQDVTMDRARARDIAFVFQLFALYPHMNVRKNIAFPLVAQGEPRNEIRTRVAEAARLLRISHLLDRPVSGLAGGDRQRVALGRAIVRRPKAFLMDEPLGTLDAELREVMVRELRELHNRIGATTVYVTHDQMEAMAMADKIAVMNHGVIEQYGTPQEIYARPASMYVADFIGAPPMNLVRFRGQAAAGAERVRLRDREVRLPRVTQDIPEGDLALGIRPEHIRLAPAGELIGSVYGVEYLGTTQIVTVDTPDGQLKARIPAHQRVQTGETVHLALDSARLSLFDVATGRAIATDLGAPMAEVTLTNLSKSFGRTRAVRDLSLTIRDGEFVVLLGPTGAGKTTTLRLIAGIERPDAGTIAFGGARVETLAPAERDVTFVFQQYSLYPHLTVRENLPFPLRAPARRLSHPAIEARVAEIARLVRIDHKLDNRATRLSGGEMQRVAIGRALVREPKIYLMDEPLSSLDAKLRAEMRLELKHIQRDLGATILYVTHDQTEAMTMADRIGILEAGRLIQIGTPREIYESPANLHVAARLGQPTINLIPPGLLPGPVPPAGTRTIGARTEHLGIARAAGGNGRIDWIEHLGDQNHLHITIGAQKLVALADPYAPVSPGDAVEVRLDRPLYFAEDGARLTEALP